MAISKGNREERVSLAHHWLVSQRGGESVFAEICKEFPYGEIHTLVKTDDLGSLDRAFSVRKIKTSLLNFIPKSEKFYKLFLPLYPVVISLMKVSNRTTLLISSDASMIKGIRKPRITKHVCYCHSPPRYIWDLSSEYLDSFGSVGRLIFKLLLPYLKWFDLKSSRNVDHFIANSEFVKERIQRIYNRQSTVLYPPVSLKEFTLGKKSEDFYLIVSALVPYKRIDLAIEAFNKLGKRLIIIGDGSELPRLKAIAQSNISFMGKVKRELIVDHYQRCRGFVFPGIEDFGITPVEAQACGKAIIAFKAGGALETVIENETGIFFDVQDADSLEQAIINFEKLSFDPNICRQNANRFSQVVFREKFRKFIRQL
ncbi:MAG: glycosyltransferase [Cyclobacteriaceae bacterium]|nr:glycosyltransferase [Cyclobacteriaceae bacterium HetDA_MAG_MS6]